MARESSNANQMKPSPQDYVFLELIGEGSFSSVFKAAHVNDRRRFFAIKICLKRQIKKEKKVDAIMRERNVLNSLSGVSPYVVQLHCTFQDTDRLYFVMTYAENGELLKFIRKGVDVACARFYAGEILMGLEHLHNKKVIHRLVY